MTFRSLGFGGGAAAAAAEFETTLVPNSVWLDGSDDYFSFATAGGSAVTHSTTKVIMATWFQLLSLGTKEALMMLGSGTANTANTGIYVEATGRLVIQCNATAGVSKTEALIRDSAWYHVLASFDLAQSGTAKAKLYLNGIEVTSWNGTDGRGSMSTSFSDKTNYEVGRIYQADHFTGSFAQSIFLDDKSIQDDDYAITDFLNAGTFGTNGSQFFPKSNADMESLVGATKSSTHTNSAILTFANSGTPGLDSSSNPNTFTNNGTVAATQQSSNSPSFLTAHLDPASIGDEPPVLSVGGSKLAAHGNTGWASQAGSILPLVEGKKFYWEAKFTGALTNGSQALICGIYNADNNTAGRVYFAATGNLAFYTDNNTIRTLDNTATAYTGSIAEQTSATVGWAVDLDNNWAFFHVNGTYINGTPNFTDGTNNIQASIPSGNWIPYFGTAGGTTTKTWEVNFGELPPGSGGNADDNGKGDFDYDVPAGYVMLDSTQLVEPTYQGIDYFKPVLYTGNGTAIGSGGLAITGTGFEPGFVWVKDRSADSKDHMLFDRVRGTTKYLSSSADGDGSGAAQGTDTESLTAFGSDGFTLGSNADVNVNTNTYVSWNWKTVTGSGSTTSPAGSTASTSIVSAAGHFSVVTFTGTGSATTVGHGLGGIPEVMFFKLTPEQGSWVVYHQYITSTAADSATDYLIWNANGAAADSAAFFDDTAPTANVFTVGTGANTNDSGKLILAYCFRSVPGVCKVGGYVGNGASGTVDGLGPYIYTGFTPSYVMIKNASASGNWNITDTTRSTYNTAQLILEADTSDDESSGNGIDMLAEGFKIRTSNSEWNGDGNTIVYLAMAEIGGNGTLPPIYGR